MGRLRLDTGIAWCLCQYRWFASKYSIFDQKSKDASQQGGEYKKHNSMKLMERNHKKKEKKNHSLYYLAAFERVTVGQGNGTVTLDGKKNDFKSVNCEFMFNKYGEHARITSKNVSALFSDGGQKECYF